MARVESRYEAPRARERSPPTVTRRLREIHSGVQPVACQQTYILKGELACPLAAAPRARWFLEGVGNTLLKTVLVVFVVLANSLLTASTVREAPPPEKPNILFILT